MEDEEEYVLLEVIAVATGIGAVAEVDVGLMSTFWRLLLLLQVSVAFLL